MRLYNFTMKIFTILIAILNYVILVRSSEYKNNTLDGNIKQDPIRLNRLKRDNQYTRWRADLDTSPFIVKVLDEETTKHKSIVGINMLTPKSREKIIVGYPVTPSATKQISIFNDYTRFMPLTSKGVDNEKENLKQNVMDKMKVIRPKVMSPERQNLHPRPSSKVATFSPITQANRHRKLLPDLLSYSRITEEPMEIETTEEYIRTPTVRNNLEPKSMGGDDDDDCGDNIDETDAPNRTTGFHLGPGRTEKYRHEPTHRHLIIETLDLGKPGNLESKPGDDESKFGYQERKHDLGSKIDDHESKHQIRTDQDRRIGDNEIKSIDQESKTGDQESKTSDLHSHNSWFYEDYDDFDRNESSGESELKLQNKTEITTIKNRKKIRPPKNNTMRSKNENSHKLYTRNETCNLVKIRADLSFNTVWTLPEILSKLRLWAENSPVAKWIDITQNNYTVMDNSIYMIIVDDPRSGQVVDTKETVMIVAGIHGRDHHAVTATMYTLKQLIENQGLYDGLLVSHRFWVIPVFNPDGYDYSVTFPKKRQWVKNLRQGWEECRDQQFCEKCDNFGLRCVLQSCYGVNLDRNFEYQWINSMEENHCHDLYAGSRQLSEPETGAFTLFLESKSPPSAFIAIKEGALFGVLYPRAHTRNPRPNDEIFRSRATKAATAAHDEFGRTYFAGQTSHFLPLYAGGIEDWIEGHLGVDDTYTIMLGSDTPIAPENLEQISHEVFAAVQTLVTDIGSLDLEPDLTRRTINPRTSGKTNLSPIRSILIVFLVFGILV